MGKTALALLCALLICALPGVSASVYAQSTQSQGAVGRTPDRGATAPTENGRAARPLWSELSPKQQAVLAPLAAEWESLDSTRRKKWVTIANRYPKMGADEQQRLQDRMQAWAKLTPEERRIARANYRALRQLPRAQRSAVREQWQQKQTATPITEPEAAPGSAGK